MRSVCIGQGKHATNSIIRSPSYVMCNYYQCNIKVFLSSEQAYQWRFVKHIGLEAYHRES